MKKIFFISLLFFSFHIIAWQPNKTIKLALNTTPAFGRKHFIIGYQPKKERSVTTKPISNSNTLLDVNGSIKKVLFAPNDDLRETLLHLIEQEKKQISIAMFAFTDKDFAQALAQAHTRGVHVEVIVDPNNVYGKYSKLVPLNDGNVQIFVYNPSRFNKKIPGAMHNKFVVFEKNINNKSLVWTGSFNFTRAAHQRNQENVVVLDDTTVVQRFVEQFNELKKYTDTFRAPVPAAQIMAIK